MATHKSFGFGHRLGLVPHPPLTPNQGFGIVMYGPAVGDFVYPYAAYPTVSSQPAEVRTEKGLGWCTVGFVLYVGALALQLALAAVAGRVLADLSSANPGVLLSTLTLLGTLGILTLVVILLALSFYLYGFGTLYQGRNEFGPAQARSVRLALYLLIAAIVFGVAGPLAQLLLGVSAVRVNPFDPFGVVQVVPELVYASLVVGAALGITTAALTAALLVLSVRDLARPQHGKFLYLAAGLGTATPGVAGALSLLQLPRLLAAFPVTQPGQGPPDASLGIPTLVGSALGLATILLYLLVYRGAQRRIVAGELRPILPPAPQWMPAPAVPWAPTYPPPAWPNQPPGPSGPAP